MMDDRETVDLTGEEFYDEDDLKELEEPDELDVVYYILNIIDTEGIDRNHIYLNISGSVSSNKEIKNILSREIRRLSVLEIPELDYTIPKHTDCASPRPTRPRN